MHIYTLIVVIVLLIGVWIVERRSTILSGFLPLLSLAWAAAMVRFDFFIHRQAAYLRALEAVINEKAGPMPLWETWKITLQSTRFLVPLADLLALVVLIVPTLYLLFGPSRQFFKENGWKNDRLFAWGVSILFLMLLCSLPIIPIIAGL
jgi:hypothetical protein